jgi:hypothetical protein
MVMVMMLMVMMLIFDDDGDGGVDGDDDVDGDDGGVDGDDDVDVDGGGDGDVDVDVSRQRLHLFQGPALQDYMQLCCLRYSTFAFRCNELFVCYCVHSCALTCSVALWSHCTVANRPV